MSNDIWYPISSVWRVMICRPGKEQYDEQVFNSLAPGKFEENFRYLIFQIISVIDGWVISCEFALWWMLLNLTDKSTLVLVMAWCRQAISHYLIQFWPRSLSPYGVTRTGPNESIVHPNSYVPVCVFLWVCAHACLYPSFRYRDAVFHLSL